jgi:hypothetical protein
MEGLAKLKTPRSEMWWADFGEMLWGDEKRGVACESVEAGCRGWVCLPHGEERPVRFWHELDGESDGGG